MKPVLIFLLYIPLDVSAQYIQEPDPAKASYKYARKFQIGLNCMPFGYNECRMIFYNENETDGPPVFSVKKYYSLGVSGLYRINNLISLGTGISFSNCLVTRRYHIYTPDSQKVSLIEVPLILRFEFLKFLYASQGLILHFEINDNEERIISRQSGIGYFISLGFNYNFKSGLSIYAGPVAKINTVPFFTSDTPGIAWSNCMLGIGFNCGVTVRL